MIFDILFCLCIFLSIWQGTIIFGKMVYKERVEWVSIMFFSATITGVVSHIIHIW